MRQFPFKIWKKKSGKSLKYYVIFDHDPGKPKSTGIPVEKKDSNPGQPWGYDAAVAWAYAKLDRERVSEDTLFGDFARDFFTEKCRWRIRAERRGREYSHLFYTSNRGWLVNYILPRWEAVPFKWITTKALDEWLMQLDSTQNKAPLSPSSLDKIIQTLRKVFTQAVYEGYISDNPASRLEPYDNKISKKRPFTQEEIDKLFPADYDEAIRIWLTHDWYTFFLMEKVCGLRPGEISTFKLSDWIPELHGALISRALEPQTGKVKGLKTSKQGARVKPALFSDILEDALNVYIFQGKDPDDFLFWSTEGNLICTDTSNKHFKYAAKRAGVDLAGRTQYSLRHTFYTDLLRKLPEKDVTMMAGHRNLRKEYDHRKAEDFLRAAAPIREIINSA